MLKRLQNVAVTALMACLLIGFGSEMWRASNTPHPLINQKTASQKEGRAYAESPKENAEEAIARYNKWLTIFTAILAVATIGLGFATVGLYFTGEKQIGVAKQSADAAQASAKIARGALIATERAFVFLDELFPEWNIRPRGFQKHEFTRFIYKPRWRNSGSTPTKNMTLATNWARLEDDSETGIGSYDSSNARRQRMFLGPQAVEWSEAIRIRPIDATAALQGDGHIVIWGRVDYGDIFDGTRPHFTEWCYRIIMSFEGGQLHSQPVAFSPYNRSDADSEGNEAT